MAVFITTLCVYVHFSVHFNEKFKFGAHLAELRRVLHLSVDSYSYNKTN
jgi:hypothetical protein